MRVRAYCTYRARRAVGAALGIQPLTSPPWVATRALQLFAVWANLYYIRLHGHRGAPGLWFGESDNGRQVLGLDLRKGLKSRITGAVVVIANCYGFDDQYLQGFYRAGARAVIAGGGLNWAAKGNEVVGTDLLVRWIARGLRMGFSPGAALGLARSRLWMTRRRLADRDAAEFQIVEDKTR